jgi:hypothetical protein
MMNEGNPFRLNPHVHIQVDTVNEPGIKKIIDAHWLDADDHDRFLPLYLYGFFEPVITSTIAQVERNDPEGFCIVMRQVMERIRQGPTIGRTATRAFRETCVMRQIVFMRARQQHDVRTALNAVQPIMNRKDELREMWNYVTQIPSTDFFRGERTIERHITATTGIPWAVSLRAPNEWDRFNRGRWFRMNGLLAEALQTGRREDYVPEGNERERYIGLTTRHEANSQARRIAERAPQQRSRSRSPRGSDDTEIPPAAPATLLSMVTNPSRSTAAGSGDRSGDRDREDDRSPGPAGPSRSSFH